MTSEPRHVIDDITNRRAVDTFMLSIGHEPLNRLVSDIGPICHQSCHHRRTDRQTRRLTIGVA